MRPARQQPFSRSAMMSCSERRTSQMGDPRRRGPAQRGVSDCLTAVWPQLLAFTTAYLLVGASLAGALDVLKRPLIIAHRGSPCILPEETLAGYEAAAEQGVDYLEMDAVSTRDGHLITRHGLTLDDSTDVGSRPEFAGRNSTKVLPRGGSVAGFFTCDFTLEEVRSLWATQALPFRNPSHNREHRVPTLAEVLRMVRRRIWDGSTVGVYIETKEPAFHAARGLDLEPRLMEDLMKSGFQKQFEDHVILQSFDTRSLLKLSARMAVAHVGPAPLVWLVGCAVQGLPTDDELQGFAQYGQVIAPDKGVLEGLVPDPACGAVHVGACSQVGSNCSGRLGSAWTDPASAEADGRPPSGRPSNSFMDRVQRHGLALHPWTVRQEVQYLPLDFGGHVTGELDYLAGPGGLRVQGVIADCPSIATAWRSSITWSAPPIIASRHGNGSHVAGGQAPAATAAGGRLQELSLFSAVLLLVILIAAAAAAGRAAVLWWRSKGRRYEAFEDTEAAAELRYQFEAAAPLRREDMTGMGSLELTIVPLRESP